MNKITLCGVIEIEYNGELYHNSHSLSVLFDLYRGNKKEYQKEAQPSYTWSTQQLMQEMHSQGPYQNTKEISNHRTDIARSHTLIAVCACMRKYTYASKSNPTEKIEH